MAAEIAGEDVAQSIQLYLEYGPAPPFAAGRPETAPPHILEGARKIMAPHAPERRAVAQRLAAALNTAVR